MKLNSKKILIMLVSVILYISIAYLYIVSSTSSLAKQKYIEVSREMKHAVSTLIKEKQEAISLISISLSANENIKDIILANKPDKLYFTDISKQLKLYTSVHNIWFQVIDANGYSFYRSWSSKRGDDLKKLRVDVANMVKNPIFSSGVSTGKFDMTFKSMIPMYKDKQFIGSLETIGKFNSIVEKMKTEKTELIILVDKSYEKQLTKALSKHFINGYYLVNENPNEELLKIIKKKHFEKLLNLEGYFIDSKNSYLFTLYKQQSMKNTTMGYLILAKKLDNIDMSEITFTEKRLIMIFIAIAFLILIFSYYIYTIKYKNFIKRQNEKLEDNVATKTKELYYTAHHDSLTGLPNRLLFLDRLEHALKHASRHATNVTVLFLDLDRFKDINDTYGHHIGDSLLKEVTKRLKQSVRDEDTIARLGGDEFTIILENTHEMDIAKVANKIIAIMQKKFVIEGIELHTTFSIGISTFPNDGLTSNQLLKNADTAMYKAKENGKNGYYFYDKEMTKLAYKRATLENDIHNALKEKEFEVYFQPKVNAKKETIIGLEALIRWNHPTRGIVRPDQFIPFAEEVGLLSKIDKYMMQESMKITLDFLSKGLDFGRLSLNVSTAELDNILFVEKIEEILYSLKYDANKLELEILESQSMKNQENVIDVLNEIRKLGIHISVDDFGTGYSSLSYLKKLPVDTLKIDRSFIKDLPEDKDSIAIVKTVIALANNLELALIAEGVETREQLDFLLHEGCENIQGYYYSQPLPANEIEKLLKEGFKSLG